MAPRRKRFLATRELVRSAFACHAREYDGVTRLTEACFEAQELEVSSQFLTPALSVLRQAIDDYGFAESTFPGGFERSRERSALVARRNESLLSSALERRNGEAPPLLLDALGIYSAVYRDFGIAPAGEPRVARISSRPANASSIAQLLLGDGHAPQRDVALPESTARWVRAGARPEVGPYLEPAPVLQITLLAALAGSLPRSERQAVWHHLALVVGRHCEEVELPAVLEVAETLGVIELVCQGLAVVRHLFPEFRDWSRPERFGFGNWRLQVPVRIFARRVVAATLP
jgi:hypothetical protein